MEKMAVGYRTWHLGAPPRPIKLEVPGWAGMPGYGDGCRPQPWHCKPFVDASTYGLEFVYPFASDCVVRGDPDGNTSFEGDFAELEPLGLRCPFLAFAPFHYGYTSSVDLMTPPGVVTRVEPHPRFYTDRTGECPVPVAGHLETEWWSRIFFLAFKSPRPGERHVFRKGEAYAQALFLPGAVEYDLRKMTPDEERDRVRRDEKIAAVGRKVATHAFRDHKNQKFDNKYKVMSRENRRGGVPGVESLLDAARRPRKRIPRRRWA